MKDTPISGIFNRILLFQVIEETIEAKNESGAGATKVEVRSYKQKMTLQYNNLSIGISEHKIENRSHCCVNGARRTNLIRQ